MRTKRQPLYVGDVSGGGSAITSEGVLPLLAAWAGSENITTLGTIGTGAWNADPIALGKGGMGKDISGFAGPIYIIGGDVVARQRHVVVQFVNGGYGQQFIAMSRSGTLANNDDDSACFTSFTTGASSGNGAGIYSQTNNYARPGHNPVFFCKFKTGANISNLRFFIGMFANNTDWNEDPTSGNIIALRYVSGTANFTYITKNGTTLNSVDSGLVVATGTEYLFKFEVTGNGAAVDFSINGANKQTVASNLPSASTPLGITCWLVTQESAGKTLSFSKIFMGSN